MNLTEKETSFYKSYLYKTISERLDKEETSQEIIWSKKVPENLDKMEHYETFIDVLMKEGNAPDILIGESQILPVICLSSKFVPASNEPMEFTADMYKAGTINLEEHPISVYVCARLERYQFITLTIDKDGLISNFQRGYIESPCSN